MSTILSLQENDMPIFQTKTLTVSIDAPFGKVIADLADPATHPEWATEFFKSAAKKTESGEVLVAAPMMGGTVKFKIEADARQGILDLFLAPEEADFGAPLPVRLIKNGSGVDVLWTLTRVPGMPDTAWEKCLLSMEKELFALKARHEETGVALLENCHE